MDSKVKEAQQLVSHMLSRRSIREASWRRLSRWICPARGRFDSDTTDWRSADDLIRFTHTASQACLRGASGMTSGMTPRNATWFKPVFSNGDMMEATGARKWLDDVADKMGDCLSRGGFYQAIQSFNMDLLWAGCALLYSERADDNPMRYECIQAGSYCVETDRFGRLLAVARRISFTAQELAREFGEAAISRDAKACLASDPWKPFYVWQLCKACDDKASRFAIASQFWEEGKADNFLRESGYNEMPFFFTCWHEGITPYGTGPGDMALSDAMQMDELERRKLQGISRITDPPVAADTSLYGHLDLGPGAINYMPDRKFITPVMDMSAFATFFVHLRNEIDYVGNRLEQALYAAIFASMPLQQRPAGMSATEFLERKREALQQLGPVMAAYEPNVLTPLLYRTANGLDRAGMLPQAPEALRDVKPLVRMEFVSPLANALRQTGAETTMALFQDAASMASASQNPALLDKLDTDQMIDVLATGLGAPGSVVRSDEEVAMLRQARQQEQAMMQQMQMAQAQAQIDQAQAGALADNASAARDIQAAAGAEDESGLEELFAISE